jgi:oligosaccharide repeat unit polymerase
VTPLSFAFVFFLLLTVLNYRMHRSVLYPPFIFCLMFFLDIGIDCLQLIKINPLHENTLAIVCGAAACFTIGGWLAGLTPRELLRFHLFPAWDASQSRFVPKLLTWILVCGLPIMFFEIWTLAHGQGGLGFLMRARQAQVQAAQNGEPIHSLVLDYFVVVATITSLLFATEPLRVPPRRGKPRHSRQFWIVTVIAFFGCILSTGRTGLLLLIGGLSAIRLLQQHKENFLGAVRLLRWPLILFLVLYVALIFTNKNTKGMVGGASGIAIFFVLSYIQGPLAAFDGVVQNPVDYTVVHSHTFEFPLKAAALLHITQYTPPPKLDRFVFVPFPTNVYTVFKFYYLELGIAGMLALFILIGFLHSLLYLKARYGGRLSTCLFAFSVYSVVMVIFDDAYYSIGLYFRALAFAVLILTLCTARISLPAESALPPNRQPSA